MTDEEHLERTTPPAGGDDEAFDVFLPMSPGLEPDGATHVARMRGNRVAFMDVLAAFVATGAPLSEPLRSQVDETNLEQIKNALDGLGPAHVESIEPV